MTTHDEKPTLPGLDQLLMIRSVAPGEARGLLAVWRTAHHAAIAAQATLTRAGSEAQAVASIDSQGRPTVRVVRASGAEAHRLAWPLAAGGGGPPAPT